MNMPQRPEPIDLTDVDFTIYQDEVNYWLDIFGLTEWDVDFEWDSENHICGACAYDSVAQTATFYLASHYQLPTHRDLEQDIRTTAKHEVLELLLAPINLISRGRNFDPDQLESEVHKIINRLLKILPDQ